MESVYDIVRSLEGPVLSLEALKDPTILNVLDQHFSSLKLNKALGKKIYQYQIGYVNTSREYVEFFGSNLLGVHVIRFREADVLRFYNDVVEVDFNELQEQIREIDTVIHTYKIGGDVFNLTLVYLISKTLRDKTLSNHDRYWISYNLSLIFFYRSIAAYLSAWFNYPADPKIAQAAYANLNYKFLIKKLGSWHKVMDYRANAWVNHNSPQYKRFTTVKADEDLVAIINDGSNAIRDMVLNYYAEFMKVHQQGESIGVTQSTMFDAENEEVVRDRINHVDKSVSLIKHYLTDPHAFIRDDLIKVIIDINRNSSTRIVKETLTWMTKNVNGNDFKLIDEFVTKTVVYSFYLIDTRIEPSKMKDLGYVIVQLKNYFLSSRSQDPDLFKIRDLADKILSKVHKDLNSSLLLATRTALILYIAFRVLVGDRQK